MLTPTAKALTMKNDHDAHNALRASAGTHARAPVNYRVRIPASAVAGLALRAVAFIVIAVRVDDIVALIAQVLA